ncbi:hypothetical protein E2I00_002410, partial [Balaenoptera physalus]
PLSIGATVKGFPGRPPSSPELFPVVRDPVTRPCIPVSVTVSSPPAGLAACRSVPCRARRGAVPRVATTHPAPVRPAELSRDRPEPRAAPQASVSSGTSLTGSDSVHFVDDDKSQQGLPDVAESTWWFKSFFQSEPVLSNVKREDQAACGNK